MNYLVLNGGANKDGNAWRLFEAAKALIRSEDASASFREIHLIDEGLPFCRGCSTCFRLGHEKCPHRAVALKLIRAIEEADGVVLLSPAYNMRETALLKNLFDHLSFMLHRPHFFTSRALILTTAGGVGAKAAAKSIASFLKGIGFNRCQMFPVAAMSWNDYRVSDKMRGRLKKTVRAFRRDVSSPRLKSPSALVMIPYNLFRGMAPHYAKGTAFETEDGVYWPDGERRRGVYDKSVPVPFYKKPVGHFFYLVGRIAGGRMAVTYRK